MCSGLTSLVRVVTGKFSNKMQATVPNGEGDRGLRASRTKGGRVNCWLVTCLSQAMFFYGQFA